MFCFVMDFDPDDRTRIVSIISTLTLTSALATLLLSRGINSGIEVQMPETLIGIVILGSGSMLLIENLFNRNMELDDPQDLQFIVGVPGSIVALVLGFGYLTLSEDIVNTLGGFEGGIYLGAIAIILIERITNLTSLDLKLFSNS
jgi:hypothetical protein